jgi:hypothetical protein
MIMMTMKAIIIDDDNDDCYDDSKFYNVIYISSIIIHANTSTE